jgi:hypothetical protein
LIGVEAENEDYDLNAELIEVRKSPTDTALTALIEVKGTFVVLGCPTAVNAHLDFTFEPPAAAAPSAVPPSNEAAKEQPAGKEALTAKTKAGLIEARGHISKVRMAHEFTVTMPGNDGRFKQTNTRRLLLERRIDNQAGTGPLSVPAVLPTPTVENSWLSYEDAQGRFHLLHPQEFRVTKAYPEGGVDLKNLRPDGQDVIEIALVPKTGDPQRDRIASDPVQQKKIEEDQWKNEGQVVFPGPAGWLPDAEWSPLGRKVYRFESALRPAGDGDQAPRGGRFYYDHYIVQFRRNETLRVVALTTQDPHLSFRNQVELVIKNFELGPSDGSIPVAPTPGSGSEPPPSR